MTKYIAHPLSRLIVCVDCGITFTTHSNNKKVKRCPVHQVIRNDKKMRRYINKQKIERAKAREEEKWYLNT
jgi:fructose-specific phosphotransferase system component IIB